MYKEADTWYGAKFKNKISDIEEGIVKLRPPLGLEPFDIEFFFLVTHTHLTSNGHLKMELRFFKSKNLK